MAHKIEKGWGDYNGSIIYVTYSEEKYGYLQDGDDVNIIPVSEIQPIRLDDSRISQFRIAPFPAAETDDYISAKETTDCFLEESFNYNGKEYLVSDLLKNNEMEYVDQLQAYLSKQSEIVVDH